MRVLQGKKEIAAIVLALAASLRNPLNATALLTFVPLQHVNSAANGNNLQGNNF